MVDLRFIVFWRFLQKRRNKMTFGPAVAELDEPIAEIGEAAN